MSSIEHPISELDALKIVKVMKTFGSENLTSTPQITLNLANRIDKVYIVIRFYAYVQNRPPVWTRVTGYECPILILSYKLVHTAKRSCYFSDENVRVISLSKGTIQYNEFINMSQIRIFNVNLQSSEKNVITRLLKKY